MRVHAPVPLGGELVRLHQHPLARDVLGVGGPHALRRPRPLALRLERRVPLLQPARPLPSQHRAGLGVERPLQRL
eukprot:1194812-Prorocentrum_minimum.AAC.4